MKTRWMTAAIAATLMLSIVPAQAGDEGAWFDMANCSMCVNLTTEEGLLDHMTWENHIIANGALSFTAVDEDYKDAYARMGKAMEAAGNKLMAGEQLPLCNFCQSYGALMMAGAKMEIVETAGGEIGLITSTDPAVVKKIHAHTQRTIDEFAKMFGGEEAGHEGHGH